jgi:uncharacterized protein YyaL (SSP411 family)
MSPQPNRLAHETSPYLLQHAHNPVDWYPWGPEALQRSKDEDRLILLSIGYSACHWCHVMAHESFEDESIASLMNEHFINVKVDREERPDLDEIYMAATQAMNRGQGGWPMTVFLTPDLEPVFAGTYFPPTDRYGRPGFGTLLTQIAEAWKANRQGLVEGAAQLVDHLRSLGESGPSVATGENELRLALDQFREAFDATHGGFGPAPKFPPTAGISLLLRLHRRFGDSHSLLMVRKTLDGMARGGIYDHIGGGFARYSTDRQWLVPHFEKMLYDNALLVGSYLEAYQATGEPRCRRVAVETLDYVLREMTSAEGGFYSSTDADSEGEEGKFFVWTPGEVRSVLGDEKAKWFCAYYDITQNGNWEGKSIPNTPRSLASVAKELGATPDTLGESLEDSRARIYDARTRRTNPGLDDKVLTSWNGLMISALSNGYRVLGDVRYLRSAAAAADFILARLRRDDGRLLRTYRMGKAHLDAYLEDYAYLSEGLLDLYEAGGGVEYLRAASALLEVTIRDFHDDESGAFYSTGTDHEKLIIRHRDGTDGATPSANAVTASALVRLSYHLDRPEFREVARRAIEAYGATIARFPRAFATSLSVLDRLSEEPVELVLAGKVGTPDLERMREAVAQLYLANRIQVTIEPETTPAADLPLPQGKGLVDGRAALYICRNFACQAPITDPSAVGPALAV